MRVIALAVLASLGGVHTAWADDVFVNGYTRSDGAYVAPHHRTAPDEFRSNNYSYQGNQNPYTGSVGWSYGSAYQEPARRDFFQQPLRPDRLEPRYDAFGTRR